MPLSDEEVRAADEAYAALPGTKPDGYSWTYQRDIPDGRAWFRAKFEEWIATGMTHARATFRDEDGTLWLEVWKERPRKEAPFDPPYIAESEGERNG